MFSFLKSSKIAKELVDKRTALIENAMLQMLAGITFYVSTLGKLREAVISADSDGTFSGVIGKTPFEIKASYPLVSILFKGSNEEFVAFRGVNVCATTKQPFACSASREHPPIHPEKRRGGKQASRRKPAKRSLTRFTQRLQRLPSPSARDGQLVSNHKEERNVP